MAPVPISSVAPPVLSAEVFSIPIEGSKYIIFAPARRAAFAGNAEVVRLISQLQNGMFEGFEGENAALLELMRALDIVDAGPEHTPSAACQGVPVPVAVTLFLTTACNLRCTYCYEDFRLGSMPEPVAKAIETCADFDAASRSSVANIVCFGNALAKQQGLFVGPSNPEDDKALVMIGRSLLGVDDDAINRLLAGLKDRVRSAS